MQAKKKNIQVKERKQQPLPVSELSALSLLGNSMLTRIGSVSIWSPGKSCDGVNSLLKCFISGFIYFIPINYINMMDETLSLYKFSVPENR